MMHFFLFIMMLLLSPNLWAQSLPSSIQVPNYDRMIEDALKNVPRDILDQAAREQVQNLQDKALNKATNFNPYEGEMKKCMETMQKCTIAMQNIQYCPASAPQTKPADAPAVPNFPDPQTGLCPDGSKPDLDKITAESAKCQMPANCEAVMQNYIKSMMVGGTVKSVGGNIWNSFDIPNLPNLPKVP